MKNYAPREGSYSGKALAFLMANGETPTGPLSEAIGCEPPQLHGMIEHAVTNGAIAVEKRDGLRYWRVGDGLALLREKDEPIPPRRHRRIKPAPGVNIDEAHVGARGEAAGVGIDPEVVRDARPESDAFACALWSDGRLSIINPSGGKDMLLSPAETKVLVRYLDQLATEVAA